jgi:hypothetical protein
MNPPIFLEDSVSAVLFGGLGNQLFQYCAARQLAEEWKVRLEFYEGFLRKGVERRQLEIPVPTRSLPRGALQILQRRPARTALGGLGLDVRFEDKQSPMGEGWTQQKKRRTLLFGYWQDRAYFPGSAHHLREMFSVPTSPNGFVGLHIRMPDTATPASSDIHGRPTADYVLKALETDAFAGLPVRLFSNRPTEALESIGAVAAARVADVSASPSARSALVEMAGCSGLITSNSTLSWWAATLSAGHAVVAPARWYLANSIVLPQGFLADSWKVIPNDLQ